ncbi:MAG TPA: ATP-binding protein, partial [Anaerolineales bacterium]|nr:ATP-binding protein [Anaerolineales bacterium]
LRAIFKSEVVEIATYDRNTDLLTDRYCFDRGDRTLWPAPLPLFGFRKQVVQSRSSLVINRDMRAMAQEYGNVRMHGSSPKAAVFVPVLSSGEVHAILSLQDIDHEDAFSASDVRLLETLAGSMSAALENARLFDETQRLLKETEQRAAELAIINSVQEGLASNLDMQAIYELVGGKIQETFHADTVSIVMYDLEEDTLTARYYYEGGQRPPLPGAIRSFGFRKRVLETRKPLVINRDVGRLAAEYGNPVFIGDMPRSCLFVPMLVGERVTGIVSLQDMQREDAYTDADVRLLTTLANSMSVALENARLYAEARHARLDAEQANHAKTAFLANMSHELRTPLNAIIGFTRIVRRKGAELLPEKQLENLDKVSLSAENLLGLINTVLDIAKIEAGRMDVLPANFRLGALIDLCANTTQPLLKPGVVLDKQVDEQLNVIYSDQDKLRQILLNLLSNAAKFTAAGHIILSARREADDQVAIAVSDTGIGISAADLPRVFAEFQQADNSTTRKYGGTGLGLTISRDLAHLLGGELTAESEPGKGSVFTLTIPLHYHASLSAPETADSLPAPLGREG